MKKLNEYTDTELVSLVGDELEKLLIIECMNDGVKYFKTPPELEEIDLPDPDRSITSINIGMMSFTDAEEANGIMRDIVSRISKAKSLVNAQKTVIEVGSKNHSSIMVCKSNPIKVEDLYLNIASQSCYGSDYYEKNLKQIIDTRAKNVKVFKELRGWYDDFLCTKERVFQRINEAFENISRKEFFESKFQEFLFGADGNKTIAKRFYKKSYPEGYAILFADKDAEEQCTEGN